MNQEELRARASELIAARLERAVNLTESDLFAMNVNLPADYKYQSIREVQTVLVKGAFDALAFTVELGLMSKPDATEYWQELHRRYSQLWPGR